MCECWLMPTVGSPRGRKQSKSGHLGVFVRAGHVSSSVRSSAAPQRAATHTQRVHKTTVSDTCIHSLRDIISYIEFHSKFLRPPSGRGSTEEGRRRGKNTSLGDLPVLFSFWPGRSAAQRQTPATKGNYRIESGWENESAALLNTT